MRGFRLAILQSSIVGPLIQSQEVRLGGDRRTEGPVSYFPSIENKYGPVSFWLGIPDGLDDQTVAFLSPGTRSATDTLTGWSHTIGHGRVPDKPRTPIPPRGAGPLTRCQSMKDSFRGT